MAALRRARAEAAAATEILQLRDEKAEYSTDEVSFPPNAKSTSDR